MKSIANEAKNAVDSWKETDDNSKGSSRAEEPGEGAGAEEQAEEGEEAEESDEAEEEAEPEEASEDKEESAE